MRTTSRCPGIQCSLRATARDTAPSREEPMKPLRVGAVSGLMFLFLWPEAPAQAQNYPAPREGVWVARDFKFHTGDVIPEVRLAYTTVGEPSGQPVLLLHGTTGSARSMLTPAFAGELFGPG